jgi:YbbR domain-containing protein
MMISILRGFLKSIPTLILALILAVAVWISAVNAADPISRQVYPRSLLIERVGLDSSLVVIDEPPTQATVTMSAPRSVWDSLLADRTPARVTINLTGLGPGTFSVPVDVRPLEKPSKVVSVSPSVISITLEKLVSKQFKINLVRRGDPAVGFQAETATLSQETVTVSGPASRVDKIKEARVLLDINQINDTVTRKVDVQLFDTGGVQVEGLSLDPTQVTVNQPVSQLGGYRNVVIKVASTGQVASGYRLTAMSVFPPTITVFSSDPQIINRLPGYVETSPLDLTGVKDDIEVPLPLNLPNGVQVVGDQTVVVQVGGAAIEGSITLSSLPVKVTGLPVDLEARISPESVDVIISGPVPLLDRLTEGDVVVFLDLSGASPGTYQYAPKVTLGVSELKLESILPSSIEVVVGPAPRVTPTHTSAPGVPGLPTPTPTPTPKR